METVLIVLVVILFIVYLVSRSSHAALSDMGDDRIYKKEIRLFTFEIVFALVVGIMGIITFVVNNHASLATTGPASYGGVLGGIFVAIFQLKNYVKVMNARETCLQAKRTEEIEMKNPHRTENRRRSMQCDPQTEWRCPRCQSVNSKYTGTCGCGYSIRDTVDFQEKEQPKYCSEIDCDPETEWKCPECGRINSSYVGTCGCGCRRDE